MCLLAIGAVDNVVLERGGRSVEVWLCFIQSRTQPTSSNWLPLFGRWSGKLRPHSTKETNHVISLLRVNDLSLLHNAIISYDLIGHSGFWE